MKIQYEITEKDYIDFNIYHMENSKTGRKSLLIQQYVVPLVFLIVPLIFGKEKNISVTFNIIFVVVLYAVWALSYPRYFKWQAKTTIRKLLKEGKNENILGNHTLCVEQQGINEISKSGESKTDWDGIENIVKAKEYIYIYIGSLMAHIVPIRAFENLEQKEEFMSLIERFKKSSSGS